MTPDIHTALRGADPHAAPVRDDSRAADADDAAPAASATGVGADAASLAAPAAPVPPPAATAPAAPASPYTAAHSPAAQVAPALVSMLHTANGTQQMTLKLRPDDLGQVEIKIETPLSGPTRVAITAEKPETLNLMMHDQAQLQRALDLAGLPADGRSVTFHIAAADPAHAPTPDSFGSAFTASQGGNQSAWGSEAGSTRQGSGGSGGGGTGSGRSGGEDPDPNDRSAQRSRWLRAGLDITA